MLLFVVTFISLMVHVYSLEYLRGDRRYTYYFAALSLFTASMLVMVTAANTLQLLLGWEGMGVCSFMLIGHWWEDKPNSDAALKAFFTTRTGDIGLLIGIVMTFFAGGPDLRHRRRSTQAALSGKISHTAAAGGGHRPVRAPRSASRPSSRCTPGCPTPWPGPRRCRR